VVYDDGDAQAYEVDLQPRVAASEDRTCRDSNAEVEGGGPQ
jgi:hypothetical protein